MATRSSTTRRKKSSGRKKTTTRKKSTTTRKKTSTSRKKSTAARKKSTGASKKTSTSRKKTGARKKSTRKYSRGASDTVRKEMHEYKRGKARSGPGGKGGKVKSRKQAIAIALSEARKSGKKVPRRPSGGRKKKSS